MKLSVSIASLLIATTCLAAISPVRMASAANSSALPDACEVLRAKDAQPLLTKPIVKTGALPAGFGCRFETANGGYVDVETNFSETAPFAYKMGHTGPQGPPATLPLAGIGDEAKMAKNGNGVVALKGEVSCGASEGGVDWPRETEPARQRAQAQMLGALCNKIFNAH